MKTLQYSSCFVSTTLSSSMFLEEIKFCAIYAIAIVNWDCCDNLQYLGEEESISVTLLLFTITGGAVL